ncbi:MAG: hypothetical protein OHK006_08560 [Thermodesulfovibrionales bacterium]
MLGRWYGWASEVRQTNMPYGRHRQWSSDYYIEVYEVNTSGKFVLYRMFCAECTTKKAFLRGELVHEKGTVGFKVIDQSKSSIEFTLDNDTLTGSEYVSVDYNRSYWNHIGLKRARNDEVFFEDLIGTWRWELNDKSVMEVKIDDIDKNWMRVKGKISGTNTTAADILDGKMENEKSKIIVSFTGPEDEAYRLTVGINSDEGRLFLTGTTSDRNSKASGAPLFVKNALGERGKQKTLMATAKSSSSSAQIPVTLPAKTEQQHEDVPEGQAKPLSLVSTSPIPEAAIKSTKDAVPTQEKTQAPDAPVSSGATQERPTIPMPQEKPGTTYSALPKQLAAKSIPAESLAPPVKYYALVIGNNNYKYLPKLKTAIADATEIEKVLRTHYGFSTRLVLDGTRKDILGAINDLRKQLGEKDSLLIYYAGHGEYDRIADKSYWLPVNSQSDDPTDWIMGDDITSNIKRMSSKHILVIADSCYAGTLTRSADIEFKSRGDRESFIRKMHGRSSRTLMASGGNEPVADGGGGDHSVFANAFLRALRETERDMFTAEELFHSHIKEIVAGRSEQIPEYSNIRNSGHDGGDFVFQRSAASR